MTRDTNTSNLNARDWTCSVEDPYNPPKFWVHGCAVFEITVLLFQALLCCKAGSNRRREKLWSKDSNQNQVQFGLLHLLLFFPSWSNSVCRVTTFRSAFSSSQTYSICWVTTFGSWLHGPVQYAQGNRGSTLMCVKKSFLQNPQLII